MNNKNNKIEQAFNELKAGDELKETTLNYIRQHNASPNSSHVKFRYLPRILTAAICCILLFAVGGTAYQVYYSPVSYIDIDINPSIELVLNRFEKVIYTFAYNEDGEKLLSSASIKHKTYSNAISSLLTAIEQDGYFNDDSLLSVTVNTQADENKLLQSLSTNINDMLTDTAISPDTELYIVDSDTKSHSHDMGLSPAKYLEILEFMEIDPSVTIDECKNHSIRELRELKQNHHNRGHNNDTDTTESIDQETSSNTDQESHNNNGNQNQHMETQHNQQKENRHNQKHDE